MLKRNTKYLLVALAGLVVLGCMGLLLANLRAKGMMEESQKKYAAMGVEFAIGPLVPKVDPSQSNGAQQMLDALALLPRADRLMTVDAMNYAGPGRAFVFSQLTNWPVELRSGKRRWVSNVWDEIEPLIDPNRDDIRILWEAATNGVIVPELAIEKNHVNLKLPHLTSLRYAFRLAQIAALYDLREGHREDALEHLLGATRLLVKYDSEPFLVSQLVRNGCAEILSKAIWDALQYPGWTDAELDELQLAVASVKFVEPSVVAMHMERALGFKVWQLSVAQPGYLAIYSGSGGTPPTLLSAIAGILDGSGNAGNLPEVMMGSVWGVSDAYYDGRFFLDSFQSNVVAIQRAVVSRSMMAAKFHTPAIPKGYILSAMMLPSLEKMWLKTVAAETRKSLVVMAVAIKRYQLKYGKIPKESVELVPEFLTEIPVDWFDGKAVRYAPEVGHDFRLWAVGRDGIDGIDGGGVSVATNKSPMFDQDMIWPMPATADEVGKKREALERERAAAMP